MPIPVYTGGLPQRTNPATFSGNMDTWIAWLQTAIPEMNLLAVGNTSTGNFVNLQIGGSQVFARSNVLGTVSQAAGVPTGALMERGSNANGQYARFADGTLICTHIMNSNSGADVTWTFPSAFAAQPIFAGTGNGVDRIISLGAAAISLTALDFRAYLISGGTLGRSTAGCNLTAIGRWF